MRIYHFLSSRYGLDDLEKRRLKIAQLDDLNDPFELLSPELRDKELRKTFHRVMREMAQQFGVICFSKSWGNPVLWSHYADKHKGMCLGFDVPNNCLLKVNYAATRLANKIKVELKKGGLDKRHMLEILSTKFKDWEYEDEARIFLRLDEQDKDTGLYFKDFSDDLALGEVILGPRCKVTKTEVIRRLSPDFRGVRFIKTRLAFTKFRVVVNRAFT